ncbi:MAG: septum formation initiator family protein [Candidatus Latescibacterota bacterium]|nr:septum formation initiator family protein [Candidatus Latescibacterota bacterium]
MSPKLTRKKRLAPVAVAPSRWRHFGIALLVAVIDFLALVNRAFLIMGEKRRAVEDLQAQVAHLEAERDSLKNMLWRLENDMGYVEKVAREEYGMSKKGERVYALPSAEAP